MRAGNMRNFKPIAGGAPSLLEQLATELQVARGERAFPVTPPSTPYYTGPGGLFGVAGLERDVISSRIQPRGLADQLPAAGSNMMFPLFAYLTGFLEPTGSNPDGVCDDPPTAGSGKNCLQTAQFGRYSYQTRTLEVNRVGQQINRGEFQDLRFVNNPLGGVGGLTVPGGTPDNIGLRQEMFMRMIELGVSFQNKLGRQVYIGNPANNTANDGYREFPGLDILISTGKIDAQTGQACPSLDSDIKDFNYACVGTGVVANDEALINTLTYLTRYLRHNADYMNFGAVTWAFVMRPELFYELTAIWPCTYLTYRCFTGGGATNSASVDAADAVRMRDDMRNGNYLIVDGMRFNVILDNMIPEETNTTTGNVPSGSFASDIYVIPLTVRGGMPVTYWEYYDYRNGPMQAAAEGRVSQFFWTDSGRYLFSAKPPDNWCIQMLAKIEPRLILRTPHLAGRLQNVCYRPLQHTRDPLPDDPYFLNGGNSTGRPPPSLHSTWGDVT